MSRLPTEVPAAPEVGDRYELRETLGEGATAQVWQAWDTLLERMVALKVLDTAQGDAEGLQRVLREARATSDVVSDHVVRVQGVSGPEDEVPFIDMELCAEFLPDGARAVARPMSDVRPRTWREAVQWVIQAARGVHAAHQQGVFHRDVKPENILIRPASRRAQVTDFGLGVELSLLGEETRSARSTVSIQRARKVIAGTPVYMAPEAAHGLEPIDPQRQDDRRVLVGLDVYGLGAVLYELLAGRPPYAADPTADNVVKQVLQQVRDGPPPRLRSWQGWFRRGAFPVSSRLERIVDKAMARDPALRYGSALELAEDLEAFLSLRPTSLEPDHHLLRLGLSMRRHQAVLATLSTIALIALVLVSGGLIARGLIDDVRTAINDRREAQQATAAARDQQRLAETARDDALEAQREAEHAADLARTSAGVHILEAEERADAAQAAMILAQDAEEAAQASEAAASKRAKALEEELATLRAAAAEARESETRATERMEQHQAELAQLAKQLERMTRAADAASERAAGLDKALATERSLVHDTQRELERIDKLRLAEMKARQAAEQRAAELLAEVERMQVEVADLVEAP